MLQLQLLAGFLSSSAPHAGPTVPRPVASATAPRPTHQRIAAFGLLGSGASAYAAGVLLQRADLPGIVWCTQREHSIGGRSTNVCLRPEGATALRGLSFAAFIGSTLGAGILLGRDSSLHNAKRRHKAIAGVGTALLLTGSFSWMMGSIMRRSDETCLEVDTCATMRRRVAHPLIDSGIALIGLGAGAAAYAGVLAIRLKRVDRHRKLRARLGTDGRGVFVSGEF